VGVLKNFLLILPEILGVALQTVELALVLS
jgi:hypothetical protein